MSRPRPMLASTPQVFSLAVGVLPWNANAAVLVDAVTHPLETLLLVLAVAFAAQLVGRLTARGVKYLVEHAEAARSKLPIAPATQGIPVTTRRPIPPGSAPGLQ